MSCGCEFDTDPDDEENDPPYHYRRVCGNCGGLWWSLHCPHDGHQRPSACCGITAQPESLPEPGPDDYGDVG